MSKHTSWGVGGPADYFLEVETIGDLQKLYALAGEHRIPLRQLGAGSNVLVSDEGIEGMVLHLNGEFRKVEWKETEVSAGAAVMIPTLVRQAADRGLAGIEPLIGVPGTLGGVVVMNAGTREGEISQVIQSVTAMNLQGEIREMPRETIAFAYRTANLDSWTVLSATLRLRPDHPGDIIRRIQEFVRKRAQTQPLGTSNCGSVFKNPPHDYAARLIEAAGLKGHRIGGAQISERHANFIINTGNATAKDILALLRLAQKTVSERAGVELIPEVKLVGR